MDKIIPYTINAPIHLDEELCRNLNSSERIGEEVVHRIFSVLDLDYENASSLNPDQIHTVITYIRAYKAKYGYKVDVNYSKLLDLIDTWISAGYLGADIFLLKSQCLGLNRRYEEAKASVIKALELDPTYYGSYLNLAWLLCARGNFDEVEKVINKMTNLKGTGDEKVEALKEYINFERSRVSILKAAGDLFKSGKYEDAVAKINELLNIGVGQIEVNKILDYISKHMDKATVN